MIQSSQTLPRSQALDQAVADLVPDGATARDVLVISRGLSNNPFLRQALSDVSTPVEARRQVAQSLLQDKVTPTALSVLDAALAISWTDGHALVWAMERQGVRAIWRWADQTGVFDQVIDELFAAGQLVTTTPELRRAVTDFTVDPERRRGLVQQVFADKVQAPTLALIEQAAVTRYSTFEDAIDQALAWASQLQRLQVAVVTVAQPLTSAQQDRLTAALASRTDRPIRLEQVIDPAVIGGLRVELGDDVIDATVTARLAAARRYLT
ncbi:MAG: ATP synthase F1 subunit delta [Propionibacteriaceae bacterium]|jgi:F-type H+-transporting ATPase subunit delta|nr:ATP synthase F1 subunit delta [Propionibacteriaceae bacterium]